MKSPLSSFTAKPKSVSKGVISGDIAVPVMAGDAAAYNPTANVDSLCVEWQLPCQKIVPDNEIFVIEFR